MRERHRSPYRHRDRLAEQDVRDAPTIEACRPAPDEILVHDDNSYPLDVDYFERARTLMQTLPDAALVGASMFHRHETVMADQMVVSITASVGAGGVVLRIGLAGADPPAERTT